MAVVFGKFFSPWPNIWEVETFEVKEVAKGVSTLSGAFSRVCRGPSFAEDIPEYKNILERSESESERKKRDSKGTDQELSNTLADLAVSESEGSVASKNGEKTKKAKKKSSKGSRGNRPPKSPASSVKSLGKDSGRSLGSSSGRSPQSPANSNASFRSQSVEYPAFSGQYPSTRAHMIPDPDTTECYRYYVSICQAVVGFKSANVHRLQKIAKGLADSKYNFLRAPTLHGEYFDKRPCWILVPACSFEKIRNWKPSEAYPVLAVARGFRDTEVAVSYRMMCTNKYDDMEDFDAKEAPKGYLKKSKCKREEFDRATENLRHMTLAMAETLVDGTCVKVGPNEILRGKGEDLGEKERSRIIKKIYSRIAEEGAQRSLEGAEESGGEESENLKRPLNTEDYHVVQFQDTTESLKNDGVKLPKAKEDLDIDSCELLQFEVDPTSGIDLYPDPMLLLIKAAINWSWCCRQKLLPVCGCANKKEGKEGLVPPSTPVPTAIEFKPVPVTPDDDDITV